MIIAMISIFTTACAMVGCFYGFGMIIVFGTLSLIGYLTPNNTTYRLGSLGLVASTGFTYLAFIAYALLSGITGVRI